MLPGHLGRGIRDGFNSDSGDKTALSLCALPRTIFLGWIPGGCVGCWRGEVT